MNIHEYQGKELLTKYGIPVQRGKVATTVEEAVSVTEQLQQETGTNWVIVKAQVHAGGRGKAGGVKLAKNMDEVREKAGAILGMTLVTPQTGEKGKLVRKVLIAEDMYTPGPSEPKEYYLSILMDRAKSQNVIIYSTEGGMDIEAVAEHTPELVFKEWIDPALGLQAFQARQIAYQLGMDGAVAKQMVDFITKLYQAYVGADASLFEINPVLKTSDGRIVAVDAKVSLDGSGLRRHPELAAYRDLDEEDPIEVEAGEYRLNYVKLDGNVGCMVNGAGLAMATMDIIKLAGGSPANFLDVGGTAQCRNGGSGFPHHSQRPERSGYSHQHFWWHCSLRPCSKWDCGGLRKVGQHHHSDYCPLARYERRVGQTNH